METQKQHKNKHGVWTECSATKRACRYKGNDAHRTVPVPETKTTSSSSSLVSTIEPVVETNEDDYSVNEHEIKWKMSPYDLPVVQKRVDSLNARLLKAGATETFSYEVETGYETDPDTDLLYEISYVKLNRPTLKQNGWTFVARVDQISDGDNNNDFVVSSLSGENVHDNFKVESQKCDHCGQVRHRSKTYIMRDENGQYKQVGSSCLRPFMGMTPSFWTLDPDYVHKTVSRDGSALNGRRYASMRTEDLLALGLALSEGGMKYAGNKSERLSTKQALMNYLFEPKERKGPDVDEAAYLPQAKAIISDTDFSGGEDYHANMRALMKQEYVSTRHWGYVLSAIPTYMKQTEAYKKREERVPYKGYIGKVEEQIRDVPAKIVKVHSFEAEGYGYHALPITKYLVILETQDRKLIKVTTSSKAEAVTKGEPGDFVNIKSAKIVGFGEYDGDDQTILTRLKLERA